MRFAPGAKIRITAAGRVAILSAACGPAGAGPRGCAGTAESGAPAPLAPAGSLIGMFVDAAGRALAPPFFVGEAAYAIAPPMPSSLVFALNTAPGTRAAGSFTVSATLADGASTAGAPSPRQFAQHLARRLGFSASPATISAIAQNSAGWLAAQLNPNAIDDSASNAALEPKPTTVDAKGHIVNEYAYERRLVQRQTLTARQVQEKLVLHWLAHFSVGDAKVRDQSMMSHYEETLRADALGNFKQLVVDVTKEPAMLIWLDNNWNNGSNPAVNPPNENFGRELMQLMVMGTNKLNLDGSTVNDASGNALPNYSQSDVQSVAQALSGFGINVTYAPNTDPNTRWSVAFYPKRHTSGAKTIAGQTVNDPGTAACVDATVDVLVRNPSTAPFQAKELLQRLAVDNPSPQFISAIAKVWAQTVDAPDQIAQVVGAIARHPEFASSYHALTKEPEELAIGLLRQLPGVLKTGSYNGQQMGPGNDLVGSYGYLASGLQEPYFPTSVFSFYRPGHKSSLFSQATTLNRFDFASDLLAANPADPGSNTAINTSALQTQIGSADPGAIADYVLDAMADGGTPALRASLVTYLANGVDDAHLRGAVWLVATSPEYQVN